MPCVFTVPLPVMFVPGTSKFELIVPSLRLITPPESVSICTVFRVAFVIFKVALPLFPTLTSSAFSVALLVRLMIPVEPDSSPRISLPVSSVAEFDRFSVPEPWMPSSNLFVDQNVFGSDRFSVPMPGVLIPSRVTSRKCVLPSLRVMSPVVL